jgi:hypothetical protein
VAPHHLSHALRAFIQQCIPTYQAAEVLLFFAAHPERLFNPEEVVLSMQPVVVTAPAVKEYAAILVTGGAMVEQDGSFRYAPASTEIDWSIGELAHAYSKHPVSLIAAIHRIADTVRSDSGSAGGQGPSF